MQAVAIVLGMLLVASLAYRDGRKDERSGNSPAGFLVMTFLVFPLVFALLWHFVGR